MSQLSNRVCALLILALALLGTLIVVLLMLRDQIVHYGLYIGIALVLIALLLIVLALYYVLSRELHKRQMRLLEEQRIRTEIQDREEAQKRERERLVLQRQEIENKHQVDLALAHAKYLEARAKVEEVRYRGQTEDRRVIVPTGHSVVFDEGRGTRDYTVLHGMAPTPRLEKGQEAMQIPGPDSPLALPYPEPLDFSQVLRTWQPSPHEIFVLATAEGNIMVEMGETCHIGLAGPTGGGKTNTLRMLLGQFLYCEARVFLCNPNYAPVKLNQGTIEDWRPIAARLAQPPAWRIEDIKKIMIAARNLLEKRKEAQQYNPVRGRDVYIALGEWPAIVKRWSEAPDVLSPLLREARQYGIYVVSEFQDALIKTIGGDSGVRECYRTGYYFGGDMVTAKAILDLKKGTSIDESGVGMKGASYFRWYTKPATRGRVPFLSNASLYGLLGEPENTLPDRLPAGADPREFFASLGFPDVKLEDEEFAGGFSPAQNRAKTVEAMPALPRRERNTGELKNPVNVLSEPAGVTPVPTPNDGEEELTIGPDDLEMNEIQAIQFRALYPALGSIEKALRQIDSGKGDGKKLSNRYYTHARMLIRQYNLTPQKRGR